MTDSALPSSRSAWSWWEGRRLIYNVVLFVTGWIGFGIEATAISLWSEPRLDLAYAALWQGLVYVFYMAAANVFYLTGAVVESIVKPAPLDGYRRHAWWLGLCASVALPLIVATVFAIAVGFPANSGF